MKQHIMYLTALIALLMVFSTLPSNIGTAVRTTGDEHTQNSIIYYIQIQYSAIDTNPYAVIQTSMGTIKIELFKDLVPNTVDNFIKLVNTSFYDGLVFHRVIDDFVIQGGGYYPNGTHKESPFGPIDLELHPRARHYDGAIGMARTSDPNSATSQFYICDKAQHGLDDKYAVFGRVTLKSRPVVRDIASVETTTKYGLNDWPVEDIILQSASIEAQPLKQDTATNCRFQRYALFSSILQHILNIKDSSSLPRFS